MQQGRLLPLVIRRIEPAPYGTVQCSLRGQGDDGLTYILKRVGDDHPLSPASEYVCTRLAQQIQLPVCPCHVAQLPGGEMVFASREEGGILDATDAFRLLTTQLAAFAPMLSRWFAFDLFTHNEDRHLNNFIFRAGGMGHVLLGIDFGRALLAADWPSTRPPLPACNTTHVQQVLHADVPYPAAQALDTIARLGTVDDAWLAGVIREIPDAWLDAKVRRMLTRWWHRHRHKRLNLLRRHLNSGRYLRVLAHPRHP